MTRPQKRLWLGLAVMALLSPLGILLPAKFRAGDAWGEWSADALEEVLGFVPEGLRRYADLWKAPVADYNFGGADASMGVQIASYIGSGLLGVAAVGLAVYGLSRFLVKHEQ